MGTITAYLEGTQALLPAALMIGVARSMSSSSTDGHVIDTILNGLVTALANATGGGQRGCSDPRSRARACRGAERQRAGSVAIRN